MTVVCQILVRVTGTSTLESKKIESQTRRSPSSLLLERKFRGKTHVLIAVSVWISVLVSVAVSSLVAVSVLKREDEKKGKGEKRSAQSRLIPRRDSLVRSSNERELT